ncbi:MlaD family protein [Desulfosarcina ovata]|uniref:Paraquat-inducible protein B n=1 Tax=Desulfosarcina ovata subsp. ovata TaxID=2752305 RepID=A0A5K8AI57_9BACT|nr:MlaD family protein [Desulfosarcina ovata]BBO92331.1 paraquat-inducible protein B [Desulfosarcina ovata subsp. ovata]
MNDTLRNQSVIGAFVVGAVLLAVVGVIVLGSGKLFQDVEKFVLYFEGSVKGLNVGAPVTFRGVKIGSVTAITISTNPTTLEVRISVMIEIEKARIDRTVEMPDAGSEDIKLLIEKGLRAKLDLQSMVTGQLQINLEFLPDEPARLSGFKHQYMEIPTVPTTFERFARKFERLPIEDMVNTASSSLQALEKLLNNPALPEMVSRLSQISANLENWTANLGQRTTPLVDSLQLIADHADQLILHIDSRLQPLARDADQALSSVKTAAEKMGRAADEFTDLAEGAQPTIDQTLANVADLTSANSRERNELRNVLKELSEAARSIRLLASYLERHPEALITGKGRPNRR